MISMTGRAARVSPDHPAATGDTPGIGTAPASRDRNPMSEAKKTGTVLASILLLGLVVRVGYDLWAWKQPGFVPGDGYPGIALNILNNGSFSPTPLSQWYFRTPGYPLFLAALWSVVPPSARYGAVLAAQVVLSLATCGVLYVIANTAFGRRAALAGAWLFALSPSVIVHGSWAMTETLQLVWIALAVLLALQLSRSARLSTALGLGLFWGAAGLTRPEATLLLAPLLLPVLLARQLGLPARLSACATAVLAKLAVMAPWVARNYLVYGTFVLHVPLGGLGLFVGTYPNPPRLGRYETTPEPPRTTLTPEYRAITEPYWDPAFLPQAPGRADRWPSVEGMPEPKPDPFILVTRNERDMLEVDRRLAAAAWANLRQHPYLQLYNALRHLGALWARPAAWWAVEPPRWLQLAWEVGYLALLVLFVMGVRVAWRSGKLGTVPLSWLILMACHTGLLLILSAEPRYQVTAALFLYMFSGLGVAAILPAPSRDAATAAGPGMLVGEKA
jgi:hypothetical protein